MQRGRIIAAVVMGIALIAAGFLAWSAWGTPERPEARRPERDREHREPAEQPAGPTAHSSPHPEEPRPVAARPEVFARAEWGNGQGRLGRIRPDEANPEAPMSLAQANDGTVVVLDQVNNNSEL